MTVWRLAKRRWAALDGAGARRYGGRWNRRGQAIVYAAEHLSLAVLEVIVHLEVGPDEFPADYVKIEMTLPDAFGIERVASMPPNDEEMTRAGAAWYERGQTAALLVPSVVVPEEFNVLLNPAHTDFASIVANPPKPFRFDPRLLSGTARMR